MAEYVPFGSVLLYQAWSIGDAEARLDYLRNGLTGEEYRLASYEPFVLLVTSHENYQSAEPEPLEELRASTFRIVRICRHTEAAGETVLEIQYASPRFQVTIAYHALAGRPWIRKDARITNNGPACYVVSIALHRFESRDRLPIQLLDCGYRFSYPAYGTSRQPDEYMTRLGMPSILWGDRGGLLLGIQFPSCHSDLDGDGCFTCDYRPGMRLETGETFATEAAVYLAFAGRTPANARQAFQDYLRESYPPRLPSPVRFNTCGAWLEQATEARVLATLPLAKEMGADVYVIDFGWSQYERFPFSFGDPDHLPSIEYVEHGFVRRELFPNGLERIHTEAQNLGLRLGLHYETSGFPHVEEVPAWRLKSDINEGYCLTTPYGHQLAELVLRQVQKYRLGEIKLDFFTTEPCRAAGHDHLANGFDSSDKQASRVLELMRRARTLEPDLVISLFTGGGYTSPWWLRYADQLHSGDPGHNVMFKAMLEDNTKSEAMAIERRDRWHWATSQGMRPSYCVQMDVHGFGIQAIGSVASIMDKSCDDLIPLGAGWRQTLFSNLALTSVRDVKVNPWYLTPEERAFIAKWLDWGRRNCQRLLNPRSILSPTNGSALEAYAHVNPDGGFVFCFNPRPETVTAHLDLKAVYGPGSWRARALYPIEGDLQGDSLELPVLAKDCLVLEVLHHGSRTDVGDKSAIAQYRTAAPYVRRAFRPVADPDPETLLSGLQGQPVRVVAGAHGSLAEQRLARRALRLFDLASAGRAQVEDFATDSVSATAILCLPSREHLLPETPLGRFERSFGGMFWRMASGELIDGCLLLANPPEGPACQVLLIATALEHLARGLNRFEDALLTAGGFVTFMEFTDPTAFSVSVVGDPVSRISPLLSHSVRFLSPFSAVTPFALADVSLGSSAKLGRTPARRRGFVALAPAGGAVQARIPLQVPRQGQPLLVFGVGLADQRNPSFGVNLSSWGVGVRFSVELSSDDATSLLVDEPVYPELYPSGETPAYPDLAAPEFRVDFLRRVLVDLTRWRGRQIELCLRTEVPPEFQSLYSLPVWSPPQLLVDNTRTND